VESVLKQGLATPGPVMIDIKIEPEEGVYPMVRPGAALSEMALVNKSSQIR
jgi:acetolactate synthase-1/2/3 large subunit